MPASTRSTFPILKDPGNVVADLFGAERTPDAFVLDSSRTIRYRGMIDNQYGVGFARPAATENYVADAVDELLAGKDVSRAGDRSCRLLYRSRATAAVLRAATSPIRNTLRRFSISIASTVIETGQVAPFALTSYDEAAGWAETIAEVVAGGRMPPWFASPEYGHFLNDARLSDGDKELICDLGAQRLPGGEQSRPARSRRQFVEGWRIPKPDLVLKMAEPYEIPDRGVVAYQTFELDAGLSRGPLGSSRRSSAGQSQRVASPGPFLSSAGKR